MQPYFFPYLGHFALIAACDRWVVFDVPQYTPKSWISRNRVLHQDQGWVYVSVPLSNGSISIDIHEARLLDFDRTRAMVTGKLTHYRRHAPYYRAVSDLLDRVFSTSVDSLVDLNVRALSAVCAYLGIPFQHQLASALPLDRASIDHAGAWAVQIAGLMGARQYLNPLGGASIFVPEEFRARGVELSFIAFENPVYDTGPYGFEPGLSILDVLMWNSASEVREMLTKHARELPAQAVLPDVL